MEVEAAVAEKLSAAVLSKTNTRRASLVEEHRESSYEVRRALFSLLLPRPAPSHGSCRPRALPLASLTVVVVLLIVMTVRMVSCVNFCLRRGLRL